MVIFLKNNKTYYFDNIEESHVGNDHVEVSIFNLQERLIFSVHAESLLNIWNYRQIDIPEEEQILNIWEKRLTEILIIFYLKCYKDNKIN